MSRNRNGLTQAAARVWMERLLRCLATQFPVVEFALCAGALLVAGGSRAGNHADYAQRAMDALAILGLLVTGLVGSGAPRSSLQ